METRKLYYEDCHLAEFSAQVLSCQQREKGWDIVLTATAFYPEGGGQASDVGTIDGVRVLHTREEGEAVVHLCDGPLEVSSTVTGAIDYEARFLRMQQHTGEHIVSGIICGKYGYHNVGFHMGNESITIDFDGVIPAADLPAIEGEANRAVWQNLTVHCWVPSPEELPGVFYRIKRALPWPVRIVEVPGFDSCACCGVHVARTGEVGLIKLLSAIPFKGGTRMEMACGKQAMDILNRVFDQNRQVSQAFSAQITETGEAARRMNETLSQLKYRIAILEKQIFVSIAQGYENKGDVLHFGENLDSTGIRELADAIADTCGGTAAVFSGADGEGYGYCLVTRSGDLRAFGKEMNGALNGRGGGKPICIQGRVQASKAEIEAFLRNKQNGRVSSPPVNYYLCAEGTKASPGGKLSKISDF